MVRRRKSRLDDTGLNTLCFSNLGLHGREGEIAHLKECLSKLATSASQGGAKRELVLISGFPGSGKTALASTLQGPVELQKGAFLSGKFDFLMQGEPYSAIASVCCELCRRALSIPGGVVNQETTFDAIRAKLIESIDNTGLILLTNIVPGLQEIIGSVTSPTSQNMSDNQSSLDMKTRLVYAFQNFIRIMASFFAPLVIFLDDLQWSNIASLELIENLMTDESMENLIVIGCYRSNEVDETHHLSKCVRDLKRKSNKNGFIMSQIEVGDLSIAATNSILMTLLRIDDEPFSMPLATLCHKRTLGNAFFLLEFIAMMKDKDIIEYNFVTLKWSWDIKNVEKKTEATGNVVGLLKDRINTMTNDVNQLLQICSCLGSNFEEKILYLAWMKLPSNETSCMPKDKASFDELLNKCIEEGYLEMIDMLSCRFIHDKVQEAAMSLVPSHLLPILRHDIGMILLDELEEDDVESNVFVVTNLLNSGDTEDIRVADMNIRASERAKSMSAFSSASAYAEKGITILPADSWENHRQLTLRLYSIGAEAECYLGNVEKSEYYCREVLRQDNLSIADKRRIYLVLIENKDSTGHPKEALEICLDILKRHGCNFPKSKLKRRCCAISGLLKLQKCPPIEQIAYKQLSDPEMHMMMNLMLRVTAMAYRTANIHLGLMSTIRRVRWSLKHGLCAESIPSLAQIGYVVMHSLGKIQEGVQYGEIVLLLIEETPNSFHTAQTIFVLYFFIFCWVSPHQSTVKKLFDGYEKGMQVGNIEWAMWCITSYIFCQMFGGKTLEEIQEDCSIYAPQVEAMKKKQNSVLIALAWQTVENLSGRSDSTTILTGERMDEDKLLNEVLPSTSSKLLGIVHYFYKLFLCVFFGDYELGAKMAIERGNGCLKELPGQFLNQIEPFFRGICLYAMARKTKKAKYIKCAKKVRSLLQRWVKNRFMNVIHYLKILDAEQAALTGKFHEASKFYEEACVLALRQGLAQDAALVNERYADLLLESKDKNRLPDAVYRLNEAIKLYKRWGAHSKVRMLLVKHADISVNFEVAIGDKKS